MTNLGASFAVLVLCFSTTLAATSDSLVGSERCTEGPAYWCTSQSTATECNTYHYCTSQVWANDPTVDQGSEATEVREQDTPPSANQVLDLIPAMQKLLDPEEALEHVYSVSLE